MITITYSNEQKIIETRELNVLNPKEEVIDIDGNKVTIKIGVEEQESMITYYLIVEYNSKSPILGKHPIEQDQQGKVLVEVIKDNLTIKWKPTNDVEMVLVRSRIPAKKTVVTSSASKTSEKSVDTISDNKIPEKLVNTISDNKISENNMLNRSSHWNSQGKAESIARKTGTGDDKATNNHKAEKNSKSEKGPSRCSIM